MPNQLKVLKEFLAQMAKEVEVLPASGQATVDEATPDAEEREEEILGAEEHIYETLWEKSEQHTLPSLYVSCPPVPRQEDHLFRYFVDGSFRSYFIGTMLAPQWDTPLYVAQIGACVLRRHEGGSVTREQLETRQLLCFAKYSDNVWHNLEVRLSGTNIVLTDTLEKDQLTAGSGTSDLRDKAAGKVRWQMHLLEAEVIKRCLPKLKEHCWLVADGSLRFSPLQEMLSAGGQIAPVIGVAKNFRRNVHFKFGTRLRGKNLTLYRLLEDLPYAHRTVVFGARNGKVVFWYVRLREQGKLEYPLMGVVKAELINPTGEAVPSGLIDRLSRALVAERNVTPHGRDRRWHAHLYPIYLAETAIKASFYSPEAVRAALFWR